MVAKKLILLCFIFYSILITYYLTYLMTKTYENMINANNINHRLQLQIEYTKRSSSMIVKIRKEKHEIKNKYFYIQSLVKSHKYEKLEHYLDTELAYHFNAIEEFQTGNKLIDFLLTQKVSEAHEQKIRVMTNVLLPPDLPIKDDDICALLLNILDNAIDASKHDIVDKYNGIFKTSMESNYFVVLAMLQLQDSNFF